MNYNRVTLVFDIALLLKQVQLRSLYTASHNSSPVGETLESSLSVTDAELDLANINMRDAAHFLYLKFQPLTRNSSTPYQYDFLNPTTQKRTITYELWLNENWDVVLTPSLSIAAENILVNFCLKDWYATTGQQVAHQITAAKLQQAENELKSIMNSRKKSLNRPYRII